jgi:hypothetical protein
MSDSSGGSSVRRQVKEWAIGSVNNALRPLGAEIVRANSTRFQIYEHSNGSTIPGDAALYLRPENPKFLALKARYSAFDPAVTTPFVWTEEHVHPEDICYFRGDNAWVRQARKRGEKVDVLPYTLSLYYLKSVDRLGLFETLDEDDAFGNVTFRIDGRSVSRDLLDSVAEIHFLNRHLGLGSRSNIRVIDVGAGYGRLAHRLTSALPGIESVLCTDAVAASTFVSDYYLRFRGADNAYVVPLDEIDNTLRDQPVEIGINIHSFSECRTDAIEWWARLLERHRVRYLVIAPNAVVRGGEHLATDDGRDMLPVFERHGYRTIVKEPKFLDPVVQEYGLAPTWYHLLELQT